MSHESRFLPLPLQSIGHTGWKVDTMVNWLTTAVWHAASSADNRVALPTLSSLHTDDNKSPGVAFEAERSLWNAVLQLSLTSLGWQSPALGFLRWREEGYPTDDPRLEVIAHLLGDDLDLHTGHLLLYLFGPYTWGARLTSESYEVLERVLGPARPVWLGRYEQEPARRTFRSPLHGGTDALHLQVHVPIVGLPGIEVPVHGVTDQIDAHIGDGRAVIMLDDYANWYGKLTRFGRSLTPRPDGRSWRVDVVVKPVGWLGTYRLSRDTGRWFSGKHSLHEWGAFD